MLVKKISLYKIRFDLYTRRFENATSWIMYKITALKLESSSCSAIVEGEKYRSKVMGNELSKMVKGSKDLAEAMQSKY